jgi:hypothetical protein
MPFIRGVSRHRGAEDRISMRVEFMEQDSSAASLTLLASATGLVRFVNRQSIIESTASAKPVPV